MNDGSHIPEEELWAYQDEALDEAEMQRIAAHLDGCDGCRQALTEMSSVLLDLRSLPMERAPAGFLDGVREKVADEALPGGFFSWLRTFFMPGRQWQSMVAVAAVALFVVVVVRRPESDDIQIDWAPMVQNADSGPAMSSKSAPQPEEKVASSKLQEAARVEDNEAGDEAEAAQAPAQESMALKRDRQTIGVKKDTSYGAREQVFPGDAPELNAKGAASGGGLSTTLGRGAAKSNTRSSPPQSPKKAENKQVAKSSSSGLLSVVSQKGNEDLSNPREEQAAGFLATEEADKNRLLKEEAAPIQKAAQAPLATQAASQSAEVVEGSFAGNGLVDGAIAEDMADEISPDAEKMALEATFEAKTGKAKRSMKKRKTRTKAAVSAPSAAESYEAPAPVELDDALTKSDAGVAQVPSTGTMSLSQPIWELNNKTALSESALRNYLTARGYELVDWRLGVPGMPAGAGPAPGQAWVLIRLRATYWSRVKGDLEPLGAIIQQRPLPAPGPDGNADLYLPLLLHKAL